MHEIIPHEGFDELPASMRFFIAWRASQVLERTPRPEPLFASSQFDTNEPDEADSAATTLMDLLTFGEEGKKVKFGLAAVLDKRSMTRFLFEDGSAIDLDIEGHWWRVSGQERMLEKYEYAFNYAKKTIERQAAEPVGRGSEYG